MCPPLRGKKIWHSSWRSAVPCVSLVPCHALFQGGEALQAEPPAGRPTVHAGEGHHGVEKHQDQHAEPDPATAEARPCGDRQQGRGVGLVVLVVVVVEVVVVVLLVMEMGVVAVEMEGLGGRGLGGCVVAAVWGVVAGVPLHLAALGLLVGQRVLQQPCGKEAEEEEGKREGTSPGTEPENQDTQTPPRAGPQWGCEPGPACREHSPGTCLGHPKGCL